LLLVTMPPPTPSNRLTLRLAKVCCAWILVSVH
jgi:hypothetical protein